MSERLPTPEQEAAIRARQRHILLEAGAGTGKTTVLVDRFCDLVEHDEVAPERILAFTFTEAAGAQLNQRVRAELNRRAEVAWSAGAEGGGDAEPEGATQRGRAARLRRAARGLSSAWVMTIHAFCSRVLASHAVAAGLDPGFATLDTPACKRLKREAFEAALSRFLDGDGQPAEAAKRESLVAAYDVDPLRTMIVSTYDELRSHGQLRPTLPEPPEPDPEVVLAELERAAERLFDGEYRKNKHVDDKLRAAWKLAASRAEWLGHPEDALRELAALGCGTKVDGKREVEAARARAVSELIAAGPGRDAHRRLAALLEHFGEAYEEAKRQHAAIDFDDMQLLATALLRARPAIGAIYHGRFDEIMVDEFQDTNPSQIALIEAVRGPNDAAPGAGTSLFQVGDEFQSIYGFRHADLDNFRTERRRLRGDGGGAGAGGGARDTDDGPGAGGTGAVGAGGALLELRGNFRSRSAILAAANAFATALMEGFTPLTVGSAEQADSGSTGA
ncbi:MAG TPA: UvrD-helicase domain-containing protein, partial [Solirubrobacterales bacterium]|nr:UvrD-helicase domain-containing protein [Solirubrobacterales bacterium]